MFFSNFVPNMHRFSDTRLQKCSDLESRVNRKPYPIYQMVLLSMTLSDLWPEFQGHNIFEVEYLS